jgi:hypothetical protein
MITAPDGSAATFDFARTQSAYADSAMGDFCNCSGCRNFRAAWKFSFFEPSMLAACDLIGINPRKAFETVVSTTEGDLVRYVGSLPFYGELLREGSFHIASHWQITICGPGAQAFDDGLIEISFSVALPWVLSEANTWGD